RVGKVGLGMPHASAFAADGKRVATVGHQDGAHAVVLWKTADGSESQRLGARSWLTGSDLEAGWSKDGKTVTWRKSSAAAKGQPASFDLSELVLGPNRLSKTFGAVTEQGPLSLKSPDGKYVQLLKNKKPVFDLKLPDNRNKGGYMTLQGR